MALLIFSLFAIIVIALISSFFCHVFIVKNFPANVASVVYSNLTFHALAIVETGTLDPNWLVTSLLVSMVSLPVAIIVGKYIRARKVKRSSM